MNTNDPKVWIFALLIVCGLIALGWILERERRRRQSVRLKQQFGPEYQRTLAERGDRLKAEAELVAREKRVEHLKIVPLSSELADRFSRAWSSLQSRFVDEPKEVVIEAHRLVRDLMKERGYPVGDFERRAADISVHHPTLVETYRSAEAIASGAQRGSASTEDLRKAVVFYRALFDELLEVRTTVKREQPLQEDTAVHP